LAAAREVFGKRGFAGASLDEISEAAGLSRGALYYNFPDGKEQLFLALLDDRIAERADAINNTFATDGDGTDHLLRHAEKAASDASPWMVSPQNREWRLLFFEFALHAARNPEFAAAFASSERGMRSVLEDAIAAAAADLGTTPPIDASSLALGINALANGLALDSLLDPTGVPEDLFPTLIGLLVRGMVSGPQDPQPAKKSNGRRP
jgi:AcrR family transcriptional regulator